MYRQYFDNMNLKSYIILCSFLALLGCTREMDKASGDTAIAVFKASFDDAYAKSVFLPDYGASSVEWESGDRINSETY